MQGSTVQASLPRRTAYLISADSSYAETPRVIWHLPPPDTCPSPDNNHRGHLPAWFVSGQVWADARDSDFLETYVRGGDKCPARATYQRHLRF